MRIGANDPCLDCAASSNNNNNDDPRLYLFVEYVNKQIIRRRGTVSWLDNYREKVEEKALKKETNIDLSRSERDTNY